MGLLWSSSEGAIMCGRCRAMWGNRCGSATFRRGLDASGPLVRDSGRGRGSRSMQPDMIASAVHALHLLLEPTRLMLLFVGVIIGLAIGVLPGLSGIVGLAMLIPFTYNLDEYTAFSLLLGMAAVITSSDFIPPLLFRVPGHVGAPAPL